MGEEARAWLITGRVEMHLNSGWTMIHSWAGGAFRLEVKTDSIPLSLRPIGTWLTLRVSREDGVSFVGPAKPEEPWRKELP
jgi:hypothetical protein